jgi:hypothetical protein
MSKESTTKPVVNFTFRVSMRGNLYFLFRICRVGMYMPEKIALKTFKEIRWLYPQEDSLFEKAFFYSDDPFTTLKKLISKE